MNKHIITWMAAAAVSALMALPAIAHEGIELRTFADGDGDGVGDAIRARLDFTKTVAANGVAGAMVLGLPVSPRQTCDLCHDYDAITSAYHFQLGADEQMDANGDGFKDEFGDVVTAAGGPLHTLPTLTDITSPGQFGGW